MEAVAVVEAAVVVVLSEPSRGIPSGLVAGTRTAHGTASVLAAAAAVVVAAEADPEAVVVAGAAGAEVVEAVEVAGT